MYTQEELEEAYIQMQTARKSEQAAALNALQWIKEQPGCLGSVRLAGLDCEGITPYSYNIWIVAVCRTIDDWEKWLEKQRWAQKKTKTWELTTPHGVYTLAFDYGVK